MLILIFGVQPREGILYVIQIHLMLILIAFWFCERWKRYFIQIHLMLILIYN